MTLLPDHADDLRPGEEAFPHRVRSVSVKQNPHQIKKRSKGQVTDTIHLTYRTGHHSSAVARNAVLPSIAPRANLYNF
ncbi:hypothetical protein H5394_07760 [Paracoccus sp. MC1862]|nr:hypothetical protein [Paracoccus sp. MC1862]MBB1498034.1 hypothetical protein [Paracoccus sp. MC1862]QQO43523.1 hypothetical protein JGR78_08560 [Paracoccus sp. MC1862]